MEVMVYSKNSVSDILLVASLTSNYKNCPSSPVRALEANSSGEKHVQD
jgi:hypothetical protein